MATEPLLVNRSELEGRITQLLRSARVTVQMRALDSWACKTAMSVGAETPSELVATLHGYQITNVADFKFTVAQFNSDVVVVCTIQCGTSWTAWVQLSLGATRKPTQEPSKVHWMFELEGGPVPKLLGDARAIARILSRVVALGSWHYKMVINAFAAPPFNQMSLRR